MSSNPYDFTSGFVGAMETSAKKDRQRMEREQYEDRRALMEKEGFVPKSGPKTGISFVDTITNMAKNVFDGLPSFSSTQTTTPEQSNITAGANPITDPKGVTPPAEGAATVYKADGRIVGDSSYPVGSAANPETAEYQNREQASVPRGVTPPAGQAPAPVQDAPEQDQGPDMSDAEKVDALRARSPFLAMVKEDPKKAEKIYEEVSDFKRLSKVMKSMAAYDFVDGKGSEGLQKATAYLRALQKEGVYEAALKASHGDLEGAKKAFLEYGDIRDPNFEIVPRETIGNSTGLKGGKEKYKVFDVKFGNGSVFTLDVQKLALETLSAKDYLERGDKEFDKDYKRSSLGLHAQEIGIRAESNRIAAQDRKDRADEASFNRGVQLGNSVFESIYRSEVAPVEARIEKEMKPFENLAAVNKVEYAKKREEVEAKYAPQMLRSKSAYEAARQRYLQGLQRNEKLDPYTLYSNAYKLFGQQ